MCGSVHVIRKYVLIIGDLFSFLSCNALARDITTLIGRLFGMPLARGIVYARWRTQPLGNKDHRLEVVLSFDV